MNRTFVDQIHNQVMFYRELRPGEDHEQVLNTSRGPIDTHKNLTHEDQPLITEVDKRYTNKIT